MNEPNTILRPYAYGRDRPVVFGVKTFVGDRIVCHFCGRDYLNLAGHAWWMHGVTADAYRAEWRIPKDVRLVAEPTLRKVSHATRTNGGAERIRHTTTSRFTGANDPRQHLGTIAAAEYWRGRTGNGPGLYATVHRALNAWANDDQTALAVEMTAISEIMTKPRHFSTARRSAMTADATK